MQQLGKKGLKATLQSPLTFPKKVLFEKYRKQINWSCSTKSLFFVASIVSLISALVLIVSLISALVLGFFDSIFSNVLFSFSVD
ncbi:hypothetical protein EfmGK923_28360 (plasmid) [Enterococcus faecium]|nr:hypothetical protein EfmGK923_28360 [Enterococcus faecium]